MTHKITEPINFYKVDDYVPFTMYAPALEFPHDSYSILEVNGTEFGDGFFINLNPQVVEMMNMQELRQLIIDALAAYTVVIKEREGIHFRSEEEALDHYLAQANPIVDAAISVKNSIC